MSVEGPIIAMQRSPSLTVESTHNMNMAAESMPMARPLQLLSTPLKRERAQSLADTASGKIQPTSAQLPRRVKSPLATQVGFILRNVAKINVNINGY